jgi:hypothetical protein
MLIACGRNAVPLERFGDEFQSGKLFIVAMAFL